MSDFLHILLQIVFWLSLFILFYTYFGYALLIRFLPARKKSLAGNNEPTVSIIIPAYNEGNLLTRKLQNCLDLDYPATKLQLIFITDGSTDGSQNLLKVTENVLVLHEAERGGKSRAVNRAVSFAKGEILIFTDANAMLNQGAVKNLVQHFSDERVGGVAGEKRIMNDDSGTGLDLSEGIYWKYESWLKTLDARFYSVIGAAGELFAVRYKLYKAVDEDSIIDDFMISMQICLQGSVIEYEPGASATETASLDLHQETKRKVRIAAGGFQALDKLCADLRNSDGRLRFQFLSRKFLRWAICPALLPVLLLANIFLAWISEATVFQVFLLLHLAFYTLAALGYLFLVDGKRYALFNAPFYFIYMHWCTFRGWLRYRKGLQPAAWEKADRREFTSP